MYILSNGIFSKKLSTKYLETLLKPIRYEAAYIVLNSRNEHVIGFQYKTKLSESVISDFLFDAVLGLNSTMGRLYVLEHYNELSSHPGFVKTKTVSNVFGFSLATDDDVHSKYLMLI